MSARMDYYAVEPQLVKAIAGLNLKIEESGLEHSLLLLVKLRASQINGCTFCVDMHARDARKEGETEQRLYLVAVWREALVFSPRERAALAWTDALTKLPNGEPEDAVYEELKAHFSDSEIVKLTAAIAMINFWNRFGVGFRRPHSLEPIGG
jgi:AhpD family alkylhydroperoxidase